MQQLIQSPDQAPNGSGVATWEAMNACEDDPIMWCRRLNGFRGKPVKIRRVLCDDGAPFVIGDFKDCGIRLPL
jgi:hypothetical protein